MQTSKLERNADGVSVPRRDDIRMTYFQLTRRWIMLILLLFLLLRSYLSGIFRTIRDLWYEILIYILCSMVLVLQIRIRPLIALDINPMKI